MLETKTNSKEKTNSRRPPPNMISTYTESKTAKTMGADIVMIKKSARSKSNYHLDAYVCYYKEPAENGIFNKNEGGFDILPTNPTTVERINELQVRIVLNEEQLTSLFEQIKGRLYHKRERM